MSDQANPAERTAQLLSGADLLAAARITQGLAVEAAGAILYPDQILAVTLPAATDAAQPDPRVAEWSKTYRFLVLPIGISIQPKPGSAPRNVVINAAFRNAGQTAKQPIILDIFPATGFKPLPLSGNVSASIGVGSDLKFGGAVPASAKASVKAALSYTYAPAFANVQSGYASTASFWQFAATRAEQPVGNLPLKLTVAMPRSITARSIAMSFDVVASFGGSWFDDEVRATFVAEVLLPGGVP